MVRFPGFSSVLLGFFALTLISGCSGVSPTATSSPVASHSIQGVVHGGQQPVSGATITLWAVGTTGDGSPATALTSTATNGSGSFTLGTYTCPGGDPDVYITSSGGNPGIGATNSNILMLAALTDCNTLKANAATTFVFVDEVTTVGSLAALYPYMTSTGNLSYGSGDAAAFATAFSSVSEYTNTSTGVAPGPSLPGGYYASSNEVNTLGNIIASCVNSAGGVAGDSSACGNLFNLAKSGSVAPTNTVTALINILNNPTQNASSLFSLPQPIAPFQPSLSSAPTTWALPILPIAATPTFSVAGGTYSSAQFVTLSDTGTGAAIHYTTDGSTPTSTSTTYTGTITVSSSETINAIAVGGGFASSAVASASYTITGSTQTYQIFGQVNLANNCNNSSVPPTTITLTHSGTVVQTTTTSSGGFSFSGVPNGTYTVTPSIAGPVSLFYPATLSAVVNGNNVNSLGFNANLGYTVSGTVAYSGSRTGQTYLALNPSSSCGGGTFGTSISTKGAFTIRGVPPGSYTLQASMDNLGKGAPNASNPTGSSSVTVSTANLTGQNVTLSDPGTVTISSAPTIKAATGFNTGAVVLYNPIKSSGVEAATSYTLQWSTDSAFGTVTGSKTFAANGTKATAWFPHGLTDNSVYYFRAYGSSAGTAIGPYSSIYGPVTIGAPTGGNTVSGSVTFATAPAGPMYVGFLDQSSNHLYAEYIASPASAQAYSIQVPSGSYMFIGILDQNNDGLIDTGDIQNATDTSVSAPTVAVSGAISNENLTLSGANANTSVTTQNTNSNGSESYQLTLQVNGLVKLPVAVTLTSGPNVISPVDIASCGGTGSNCGHGFQIGFGIGSAVPTVGDTYNFSVTYSDTTTETVNASVTSVVTAFATNLSPQTGTSTSTTPTFTWTYPASAGSYTYNFSLCCYNGSNIWDIPSDNSNSGSFTYSQISSAHIPWSNTTDPLGDTSNTPTLSALTLGTSYSWQIQVTDSNGNSAVTQVNYQP